MIGWGDNRYGQRTIHKQLSNVIAVACGENHSLAMLADGTLYAWGLTLTVSAKARVLFSRASGLAHLFVAGFEWQSRSSERVGATG